MNIKFKSLTSVSEHSVYSNKGHDEKIIDLKYKLSDKLENILPEQIELQLNSTKLENDCLLSKYITENNNNNGEEDDLTIIYIIAINEILIKIVSLDKKDSTDLTISKFDTVDKLKVKIKDKYPNITFDNLDLLAGETVLQDEKKIKDYQIEANSILTFRSKRIEITLRTLNGSLKKLDVFLDDKIKKILPDAGFDPSIHKTFNLILNSPLDIEKTFQEVNIQTHNMITVTATMHGGKF